MGHVDLGAYYRGHMFDAPLRELGVEMRHISKLDTRVEQMADGTRRIHADTSDFEWADVLVLRRYYNTTFKCAATDEKTVLTTVGACKFMTLDRAEAQAHPHGFREQDGITRAIWPAIRDQYRGGIIYETDDNHFQIKPWNGYYADVVAERPLIEDMARRADLITVSTPALAPWYSRYGDKERTRVIRNAIDPSLYQRVHPKPSTDRPRLVYYGSVARMRDYMGKRVGVAEWKGSDGFAFLAVQANRDKLHRVLMGVEREHLQAGIGVVLDTAFDEIHPYISSIPAFSLALANVDGDIGIAPLSEDDFDRSKSELHWLEYALTGMAFIGQRFSGSNHPYSVVRDGVDGLLARGKEEWFQAVKRLAGSKQLRDDLAGAAKERVLAEYDYRQRAAEWKEAFVYAAEHAGIGKK